MVDVAGSDQLKWRILQAGQPVPERLPTATDERDTDAPLVLLRELNPG